MSANNELVDSNKIVNEPKEVQQSQEQSQQQEDIFECPVCYTNGATTGIVTPVCGHKLCLGCYSTMLVGNKETNKCPCCRRKYLNTGAYEPYEITDISSQDADDPYADMPALIPQPGLAEHIERIYDIAPAITLTTIIDLVNELNLAASSASTLINNIVPVQRSMY